MRITRDIVDAVLVDKTPKHDPFKRKIFIFTRSSFVGFHFCLKFHRWYWPVLSIQFWRWSVDIFYPYPFITFV